MFLSGCASSNYSGYEEIAFELSTNGVDCTDLQEADWAFKNTDVSISSGYCRVRDYEDISIDVFRDSDQLGSLVQLAYEVEYEDFVRDLLENPDFDAADLESSDFGPCDLGGLALGGIPDLVLMGDNWIVTEDTDRYSLEILQGILGGDVMTPSQLCQGASQRPSA